VTTLNALRPIHAPLPSSPKNGPQPPHRANVPVGPRPNATEPVPAISSIARALAERVVERHRRIRVNDDFLGDVATRERRQSDWRSVSRTDASHADAQHLRRDVIHVARGQRVADERRDDLGRSLRFTRAHRAAGAFHGDDLAPWSSAHAARVFGEPPPSTPTTIALMNVLRSVVRLWTGAACVSDDSIPVCIVIVVPIKTYQGQAMEANGASGSASAGNHDPICRANTTKLMAAIPTLIPVIASR
jgi:hypothetical protein